MNPLTDAESGPDVPSGSPSWWSRFSTGVAIRTQRRMWGQRAASWDRHNDAGMVRVAAAAIESCDIRPGIDSVDLGCGTGRLALALAEAGANVIGVDVSPSMIQQMEVLAKEKQIDSVRGMVSPVERLDLPVESVDLIVTNYAFHHLLDADKEKVVHSAYRWLRPGGQLVVADMMLGRGTTSRDREIIAGKVRVMARKGLPGYWRIAKNAGRYLFRVHERPITPEAWMKLFEKAGFEDVGSTVVVNEAAVVKGVKAAA
ncbi:MAG: class I SAM-dependent methyltransferase [Acidimicrobiales bacterium]